MDCNQKNSQIQRLERTPIPNPKAPTNTKPTIELPESLVPSKFYFLLFAFIVLLMSSISAFKEAYIKQKLLFYFIFHAQLLRMWS